MSHIHSFLCLLILGIMTCSCNTGISQSADTGSSDSLQLETEIVDTIAMEIDNVSIDLLLGRFDPAKDTAFEKLTASYASGAGLGAYLHKETLAAFKQMHAAAKVDGVNLKIISATRNFYRQKQIWEAKWTGARKVGGKDLSKSLPDPARRAKEILLFSSMPGTSRHHWGTDMDLNNLENSYFAQGKGLKEYEWLQANAAKFGFGQPYSKKGEERPHGYEEEKWHWSYLPLAKKYLQAYGIQVKSKDIKGFKGAEVVEELQVIDHYVFGIAPECK